MTNQNLTGRDLKSAIIFAAMIYLVLRFIANIVDIILVFSIIAIIVVAVNPLVTCMEKHKIPRSIGTMLIVIAFIGLIVATVNLMAPSLDAQINEIWKQIPEFADKVNRWATSAAKNHPSLTSYMPTNINSYKDTIAQFGESLLGGLTQVTKSTIAVITGAILIFISTIYCLANPKPFTENILRATHPNKRDKIYVVGERISSQIRAWAIGNILAMIAIFMLTWGAMALIGLKQAFLFGVIAGILEAIPIIGPVLSAVLPTIVALTISPITALWVVLAFILIQQFENHVLIPQIMARQVQLHPVTIIFSVLVMGGLFGLIGVFLATPAAVTIGILYDEFYLKEFERKNDCDNINSRNHSDNRLD